jgi:hypothetical protein
LYYIIKKNKSQTFITNLNVCALRVLHVSFLAVQ